MPPKNEQTGHAPVFLSGGKHRNTLIDRLSGDIGSGEQPFTQQPAGLQSPPPLDLKFSEPAEMSGPELAKTPGGGAPGKEGKEPVANGHGGEGTDNPFAEYMWMENEEEYNRQVEEELLEQEFLERCFQEMLEEEDQDWFIPSRDLNNQGVGQLQQQLNGLSVSDHHSNLEEVARKSILNPEAKEFVPGKKY
ncbi:Polyadenylate-binding protein-interacting protein 2B [Oryzias melastigma]|uniref:Polyadenylate-binding protein-interacting protein 2B n=2 Tax=Oryzias melastigma TaxID=30732 RepID=A0A834F2K0_ORYME|nr:Polyadenylate-binding protein-interacting protein 2B [Oryzias melastigma]